MQSLVSEYKLDNLTCFHMSFMGVSECDNSMTHTDIYATADKAFNIIFPVITVEDSKPELDIVSDDPNIVVAVNYLPDRAIVMGDWVYHKTSPIEYDEVGEMRVVIGMYCAQIDAANVELIETIYEGEDHAPFQSQFELPIKEHHAGAGFSLPKTPVGSAGNEEKNSAAGPSPDDCPHRKPLTVNTAFEVTENGEVATEE